MTVVCGVPRTIVPALTLPLPPLPWILHDVALYVAVVLGAGCFWHVEADIRRLPGVIDTEARYAGGVMGIGDDDDNVGATMTMTTVGTTGMSFLSSPLSYETVCGGKTGHAETVRVTLDAEASNPRTLFNRFLSLHNLTEMIAHGEQAAGTVRYRIFVFVPTSKGKEGEAASTADYNIVATAREAAEERQSRLGKDLGAEVRTLDRVRFQFRRAEERRQRRNKRVSLISGKGGEEIEDLRSTLSVEDWVRE